MSATATVSLGSHGLALRCHLVEVREDRPLNEAEDVGRFESWRSRHQTLARAGRPASTELLALGEELYDWLNGADQFLHRVLEGAPAPLLVEFAVAKQDNSALARAFLDAPWELLASGGRHLALAD
ncbi:MAG: hypothetical protein JNK68_09340, partial [Betaproteobacteria bacterium]|nr:hypothetical protein [Betaproteobacteria bacterium]